MREKTKYFQITCLSSQNQINLDIVDIISINRDYLER